MSITPNPDANFTPTRGHYTDLKPFRFWCQKVLPLVYDDSLSYYELLCKVVDYLNKTMEDVETLEGDITAMYTAYDQLQSYVNTYFDSLDVQEEINNKLNAMVLSGQMTLLVRPFIPDAVTSWLTTHITQPEGVVIDDSLTISGACADAQATGLRINELKDNLTTHGLNFFNPATITREKYLDKADGAEYGNVAMYYSDYIRVQPAITYKINAPLVSEGEYAAVIYYDRAKNFLSSGIISDTQTTSFTTPSGCEYIRVNGAIADLNQQFISSATNVTATPYRLINNGLNSAPYQIIGANDVFYNQSTGVLFSKTDIYVQTPERVFPMGTSVTVGIGSYLFWSKITNRLIASNSYNVSEYLYFVGLLRNTVLHTNPTFSAVIGVVPIFTFDFEHNKLYVDTHSYGCYVYHNGTFYTLGEHYTQTLDLTFHTIIYFDPQTSTFVATDEYSDFRYVGIPVLERYHMSVVGNAQYKTLVDQSVAGDYIVCYGDSLTWYDGHEFTWGTHQGETCVGFESYLNKTLGMVPSNQGESGESTPQICTRIRQAADFANYAYATIMGGDNDDRLNVPLGNLLPAGSTFNTTTVYGALQSAVEYMLTQNPELRIILMTEPMGWTYRNGTMQQVSPLYADAYRRVAELYGLPLIDLWCESGINEKNRTTYYADPSSGNTDYMYHPNNDGWKRLSKVICNKIKNY